MAEIDGLPELNRRLNAITDTRRLLGRVGLQAVAYAKQTVPRKTGNLGRTIRLGSVTDTSAQIIAGGQGGVGYARVVEFGSTKSGTYEIKPRRKKALAFSANPLAVRQTGSIRTSYRGLSTEERAATGITIVKSVRHPYPKSTPQGTYLTPSAKRASAESGNLIVAFWNEAA